jgi:hypothetical protein
MIKMLNGKDGGTREQIRGTLEAFKGDKEKTKEQLLFKICNFASQPNLFRITRETRKS